MKAKERVSRTFQHKEPDRIPKFEMEINSPQASEILGRRALMGYGGWYMAKQKAEMLMAGRWEEYVFRNVDDLLELYQKLELDMVKIRPNMSKNSTHPKELSENTWVYSNEELGSWEVITYVPENDFWFEVDSNIKEGGLDEFIRYVKAIEKIGLSVDESEFNGLMYALKSQISKDLFVVGWIRLPLPLMSSWSHVFLEALILAPDIVKKYLDIEAKKMMVYLRRQLEMGVDGVIEGVDLCGTHGPLISLSHFKEFVQPYLIMYAEECHKYGVPFIKHEDGNLGVLEEELLLNSGIDGYHGIEPMAGMDIEDIKNRFGNKITLLGNVDCSHLLVHGSRGDIIEATKDVIRKTAPGGGYVFSSSNSIHSAIPTENFMVMLEAAKKYGRYPIKI
ncbi:MAG: uroporphyrinogen decarboxylase family protein [Actinobacteria bacterium]|nr:uroporphyrinogen decarboxylase family protein [Actinomycetota bacterium]